MSNSLQKSDNLFLGPRILSVSEKLDLNPLERFVRRILEDDLYL